MEPFDKQWMNKAKRNWLKQSSRHSEDAWENTIVYHMATNEREAPARKLIAELLRCPPEDHNRLSKNLSEVDHCSDTYHEIIVGYMLSRAGLFPVYERHVLPPTGLSPDWYVPPSGSDPGCCIEVRSKNLRESTNDERLVEELCRQALQIPVPARISLTLSAEDAGDQSEEIPVEEYLERVRDWLADGHWEKGQTRSTGKFTFMRELWPDGPAHVTLLPGCMARCSDSGLVKEKIEEKIRRYGKACLDADCSFLVVFFPELFFGCELEDAQKIVLGTTTYDATTTAHSCPIVIRDDSGLFKLDFPPAGLAWITRQDSTWTSQVLLNKQARIHPPDGVLRALDTNASTSLHDSVDSPTST